ncbi:hypothetical protein ACFQX6_06275 [Streptosporangium lutulentum]
MRNRRLLALLAVTIAIIAFGVYGVASAPGAVVASPTPRPTLRRGDRGAAVHPGVRGHGHPHARTESAERPRVDRGEVSRRVDRRDLSSMA